VKNLTQHPVEDDSNPGPHPQLRYRLLSVLRLLALSSVRIRRQTGSPHPEDPTNPDSPVDPETRRVANHRR
jgi:hypothetical protein